MPPNPALYNDPTAAALPPVPEPIGESLPGAALHMVGDVLGAPRAAVKGAAANLITQAIRQTEGIQPAERIAQVNRLWDEGRPPEQIFDELLKTSWNGGEVPVTAGVADVVYDPLTYLGTGLYPNVARAAFPMVGTTARAFQWLDAADTAVAALPWTATKGAVGGVARAIRAVPTPGATIIGEGGARVAAPNLGALLFSPSANSLYKQQIRNVSDMARSVLAQGHSLEQDTFEEAALKEMGKRQTPQNLGAAQRLIGQETSELLSQWRATTTPEARLAGAAIYNHTQDIVSGLFREAQANALLGKPAAESRGLFDQARRTILAGRVLLDRYTNFPERYGTTVDPALGRDVYNASETLFNRLYPAFRNAEQERLVPQGVRGVQGALPAGVEPKPEWQITDETQRTVQDALNEFWGNNGPSLFSGIRDQVRAPIGQIASMAEARQQGVPGITAILPDRLRDTAVKDFPEMQHQLHDLIRDRGLIGNVLMEVWDRARPGQPFPVDLPRKWTSIEETRNLGQIVNDVLVNLGEAPIDFANGGSAVELFSKPSFQRWLSPRSFNGLDAAVRRWPEGDILTDEPYLLVMDRLSRQYAKNYGIKNEGLLAGFKNATALFKEQALAYNPGYLVTNLMSIMAASGAEGISPVRVANGIMSVMREAMRGGKVPHTPTVENAVTALGIETPQSITSGAGVLADINSTKEYLQRGVTTSARIGSLKLGAAGAGLGAISGALEPNDDNTTGQRILKGAAVGGVAGAALPMASEIVLRRMSAGMEQAAREVAWLYRLTDGLGRRLPEMNNIIDSVAGGHMSVNTTKLGSNQASRRAQLAQGMFGGNAPGTGMTLAGGGTRNPGGLVRTPVEVGPNQQAIQQIKDQIESRGGMVSPEWVSSQLQAAGIRPQDAEVAAKAWRTMVDASSKEGENLAARINVDYENITNAEEFMRWAFPFSTWATRMTPFWAYHVLSRPAVLIGLLEFEKASYDKTQAEGLPSRFVGAYPAGPASGLASAILGRPLQLWYNPLRGFVPYSDTAHLIGSAQQEDNPFASAYSTLTSMGPQLNPLIEFGFRTANVFGEQEPARNILGAGNRIEALTGTDLNRPFRAGEGAIRKALHGQTPTDLETSAVERRVEEMGKRALGHLPKAGDPASDPYLAARVEHSGPVWDNAYKEVKQEQALRSMLSLGGQAAAPQAVLTPEEQSVRGARVPVEQGGTYLRVDPKQVEQLKNLMATGHTNDPVPADVKQSIDRLTLQAFGTLDLGPAEQSNPLGVLSQWQKMGTVGSYNALREAVMSAQSMQKPETQGFSTGGGTVESARLQAALTAYNSPGSLMPNMNPQQQQALTDAWRQYQGAGPLRSKLIGAAGTRPTAQNYWLVQAENARDSFRKANPILDQYLNYLAATQGAGNEEDFFKNHYQR